VGIYLSEVTGAVVRDSTADGGLWGLYNEDTSTNNRYTGNEASGNSQFDCEDDSTGARTAGTANMWVGNTGATSLPVGICNAPSRTFGSLNHQVRALHASAAH
jgi:parallel beta-helix repeat protein